MPSFSLEYIENGQTQQFPFDSGSVSIGRDKASDFVLDHPTVSRQHALIVHNQRGYQLVVLSRGGMTAVDGNPVSGDVDLFDGNVLHFGQLNFTFRSPDAPAKSAPSGGGGMGAQQQGGFGQQPGFGQQQGGMGMGAQPAGGFGQQQGGFQPGGFGQQQQQAGGGFGGGMQSAGAGAGGQMNGGGFGAPGGGFGGGMGGGMGMGGAPEPSAPEQPKDPNGIMSWDEIANSAEALGETDHDNMSDFQRIQAAQAKAVEQSKGTNPLVIIVAVVLGGGMMAFTFWPKDNGGPEIEIEEPAEMPPIKWDDTMTECVGEADCMKKAERAFAVGVDNLEKQDVELSFRFEGYKNLELADIYVEKAGKERPAKFAKADAKKAEARKELDELFQKLRVEYHNAETRKMYKDMAGVINRVKTYFPHPGARENIWAKSKENDMKDRGIYPRDRFGR